jgi:phosphoglycolate phosphatase-like HAD superfamily hydrolase
MKISLSRALAQARREHFDSFTYVGDAVWDARACRSLGIPLVGIAAGAKAERLRAEGAVDVFSDFRDLAGFEERLLELRSLSTAWPH